MPVLVPLLGKFLFWVGVPFLIFTSLQGRILTFNELVAPITAWTAILVGLRPPWLYSGFLWFRGCPCFSLWQAQRRGRKKGVVYQPVPSLGAQPCPVEFDH